MIPANAWKDGLFPSHLPWLPKYQSRWGEPLRSGPQGRSLGHGSEGILVCGDTCLLSQAPTVMWCHPPSATPLTRSCPCAHLFLTSDFELIEV